MTVVSKKFEGKTDREEEWYGTQFTMEKISQQHIEASTAGVLCVLQIWCCQSGDESFSGKLKLVQSL